jgi:hypothetical protein
MQLICLFGGIVSSSEIPKEFCIENCFTGNIGSRYNFSNEKSLELTNFNHNVQQAFISNNSF